MTPAKINTTRDYEMFGSFTSNREVDERHVKQLAKAIEVKNLLHLNPIIVNAKHQIVDGQHRLEAAKKLGLPIHYVIDELLSKEDISDLNKNKKNWSMIDYINYFSIEKKRGFDVLSSLMSQYQKCPTNIILQLLGSEGNRNRDYKGGNLDVSNKELCIKVLKTVSDFSQYQPSYEKDGKFIIALSYLIKHPDYDHDNMLRKLETMSRSLVKCIKIQHYLEMLEEIYNFKSSKNRVSFTK